MIDLFGIEPTGEGFTVDGINVFTVEAGEIAEVYAHWDTLKMVQELGVVRGGHPIVEPAAEPAPGSWTVFRMSQWM